MRKVMLTVIAAACLAVAGLASSAAADELGNPVKLTPKGQFSLGVSVNYVFEQKNKDYDLNRKYGDGTSDSGRKEGKFKDDQYYLLSLTYGLTDWLGVFAQAGVVRGGKSSDYDKDTGYNWESSLDDQFVWGVGAKARAFKLDNGLTLDLAARYLRYDNRKVDDYTETNSGAKADAYWWVDEEIDYWQVDLNAVVSRSWGPVTPYVGIGYSHSEADLTGRWRDKEYIGEYIDYDATIKNDQPFAALCGVDIALGQGLALYAQGYFVARTALSVGLSWSF